VPLPGLLAGRLSHPLQRIGTIASTYLIQTLGIPAAAQGNVILLENAELGIVEACSGLKMMMLFAVVCVGAAFLLRRSLATKCVVVLSAMPIAIAANVLRITITAVLHQMGEPRTAETFYHDLAGWFMMPLAVLILWGLVGLMARLIVEREVRTKQLLAAVGGPGPAALGAEGRSGSAPGRAIRQREF